MPDYSKIACLTVVSKNRISYARVLCNSFLEHHPGARFHVLLADKNDGYLDPQEEAFTLLELSDIPLPAADVFPYQYNASELNAALKPYALRYLLESESIQKLVYLDPDIMVFNALEKVWNALDNDSIVLTPHMREPFDDVSYPSELDVLQRGIYDSGFIGVANNQDAIKLLDWWAERLYLNCMVDIPRGLFLDRKWMELIPAYCQKTHILQAPEYNVAYGNLHERSLELHGDGHYSVEGNPLAFFHFSGFDPEKPAELSEHQDRHRLSDSPALESLFEFYGAQLVGSGLRATSDWPYAYKYLAERVAMTGPIQKVIRQCLEKNLRFPSPSEDTDSFIEFLLLPNRAVTGTGVAPLTWGVLECRPDVKSAFPQAASNPEDQGFKSWLLDFGADEYGLHGLIPRINLTSRKNPVSMLIDIYGARPDLNQVFPEVFQEKVQLEAFVDWCATHAVEEYDDIEPWYAQRLKKSAEGIGKVLNSYFSRLDFQKDFANLGEPDGTRRFADWARENLSQLINATEDELEFFVGWALANPAGLKLVNLGANSWLRSEIGTLPNIFNVDRTLELGASLNLYFDRLELIAWLVSSFQPSPVQHVAAHYLSNRDLRSLYPDALSDAIQFKRLCDAVIATLPLVGEPKEQWCLKLNAELDDFKRLKHGYNIAGYFSATTGMGESSRSTRRILQESGYPVTSFELPTVFGARDVFDLSAVGSWLGHVNLLAHCHILNANADLAPLAASIFPYELTSGRYIGYWVWETERLPYQWKSSSELFDEIWTPSAYSKVGIEFTVNDVPVRVVPHSLDFENLRNAVPDRDRFGIPRKAHVFAYFFDQKSILERKNPGAVIQAFNRAFGHDESKVLVLKVNSSTPGHFRYEQLKSEAQQPNIIVIEQELSRLDTYHLLASIDVYVSLHRAEGFGLTLAESMFLGKQVVTVVGSGNDDFCNADNSFLVPVHKYALSRPVGPYPKGTQWVDADYESAAQCMRDACYEKKDASSIKVQLSSGNVFRSVSSELGNWSRSDFDNTVGEE